MILMAFAGVLSLVVCSLAATLLYRKLRQARIAVTLRIGSPRGIVDQRFVGIGGIDQWISIRGEDQGNPVLLVIHGGPGSSYSIFTPHLRSWEKHFTVVQWDQRGAGRTFLRTRTGHGSSVTMERLTLDGIEVAEHLVAQLRKERIFLLASSLGSTFGMDIVRRRPELFHAYIGTDQNVGMVRGRDENHRVVVERLDALGMAKGVRELERIGADPLTWTPEDFSAVAKWTMKSDPPGFRRTIELLKAAVWYAPGWTIRDVYGFVAGMRFSLAQLLPEMARYDAWDRGTQFNLPIFIFQGESDVLTRPSMATALFNDIIAPVKRMELIRGAGHFAAFQEPRTFLEMLLDHVRPLAVPPSEACGHRNQRVGALLRGSAGT